MNDPSAIGACDDCHSSIAAATANSLHTNLWGERKLIEQRGQCNIADYEDGFNAKCNGCHTTCGQCHISRPNSVAGGFVSAHKFRPTPHMTDQCTACHGSRVGIDYLGEAGGGLEGNAPDVHRNLGYRCEYCHSAEEIHGDGQSTNASGHYEHRYEVATMPRCEDCHGDQQGGNDYHGATHWGALQCQACHSQPYKNCSNCHLETAWARGFTIDPSVAMLKIGLNTQPELRDYEYTIVRHVPVAHDTYEAWGLTLPAYDDIPSWKYASPHNIQRWTAQTDTTGMAVGDVTCATACHGSGNGTDSFFLREVDLYEEDGTTPLPDYGANLPYVVADDWPPEF